MIFFQIINIKLYSKYQLVFFLSQKVKYLDSACSAGYTDSSGTCDGNFLKNIYNYKIIIKTFFDKNVESFM